MYAKLDFYLLQFQVVTSSANICCAFPTMDKAWILVREYVLTFNELGNFFISMESMGTFCEVLKKSRPRKTKYKH